MNKLYCTALLAVVVAWGAPRAVHAHEGHAPLPSRGAEVDVKQGVITLSAEARSALGVRTQEVMTERVDDTVLAYVTVETPWQQHAFATSRVGGRIAKLLVQPGDVIAAGQVLAEVESLELENLQLDLLNAQRAAELSQTTLARLEPLAAQGVTSGRDLLTAQSTHAQNLGALETSRLKLLSLGIDTATLDAMLRTHNARSIDALPILAPINGTVMHADLAVGKVVGTTEHLFEIVDLSLVWARIDVLERDLGRVEVGQDVHLTLAAFPSETVTSRIGARGAGLDPQSHLGTIWAELDNADAAHPRFLPGMYGQARVQVGSNEELLSVPASALITQGAEQYVLVEQAATDKASEYRRENVVVANRTPRIVQIAGGDVFPGDRVVTVGAHELAGYFIQGVLRLSPEAQKSIGLQVEPVRVRPIAQVLELNGAVDLPPERRASVSSQLSGRLRSILVDRGQTVEAGQILAEIESVELQDLQLQLLQAHQETERLATTLTRLRGISDSVSQRQLLIAESEFQTAKNQRESYSRRLTTLGLTNADVQRLLTERTLIDVLPVRASISGVIVAFNMTLGQIVQAEESLFEIHDLAHVIVQGYVAERDVSSIRIGQEARLRFSALPDIVAKGTVTRSARVLGTEDRTLSVWIELDERPASLLLYNMLASITVTVDSSSPPVLAVARDAVIREGTQEYVFVQQPDATFTRQPIQTGRSDDHLVEVVKGVKENALVAVHGVAQLRTASAAVR